jgi:peptidoglycan hydrolase CwlO-like protein
MAHLTTLGVEPKNQDSVAKSFVPLKNELAEEKAAREKAQADVETLARAVEELKKIADSLTTHVPSLEEKVKHLDNKVLDSLTELLAKELRF